eukprot:15467671-Alexandrium_andersonii.AAC.1
MSHRAPPALENDCQSLAIRQPARKEDHIANTEAAERRNMGRSALVGRWQQGRSGTVRMGSEGGE